MPSVEKIIDKMNKKNVEEYLNLPYHIKFQPCVDNGKSYYYASVEELKGCKSHGETIDEAAKNIKEAMALWIEGQLEENWEVPLPYLDEYNSNAL